MPIPLVESELIVILIGGNETTGATLCSFVQLLVENPHVYQKILAGDLSAENLARENPEFPYLKATLKEVNRYRHSAPNTFPRIVSKGGLVIPDGRFIPEGTEITMNIQVCTTYARAPV